MRWTNFINSNCRNHPNMCPSLKKNFVVTKKHELKINKGRKTIIWLLEGIPRAALANSPRFLINARHCSLQWPLLSPLFRTLDAIPFPNIECSENNDDSWVRSWTREIWIGVKGGSCNCIPWTRDFLLMSQSSYLPCLIRCPNSTMQLVIHAEHGI